MPGTKKTKQKAIAQSQIFQNLTNTNWLFENENSSGSLFTGSGLLLQTVKNKSYSILFPQTNKQTNKQTNVFKQIIDSFSGE